MKWLIACIVLALLGISLVSAECTPDKELGLLNKKQAVNFLGKMYEIYARELVGQGNKIQLNISNKIYEGYQYGSITLDDGTIIRFGAMFGSSVVATGVYYCMELSEQRGGETQINCPQVTSPSCEYGNSVPQGNDDRGCAKPAKCMKELSNGRNAEIKIMPETASQKAIERLGELDFTIELKEVGRGDNAQVVYELTGKKAGRFLGIFKILTRVSAQVDAETGEIIKVEKPWWSFLVVGV